MYNGNRGGEINVFKWLWRGKTGIGMGMKEITHDIGRGYSRYTETQQEMINGFMDYAFGLYNLIRDSKDNLKKRTY